MQDVIAQAQRFEPLTEQFVGLRLLEEGIRPEIFNLQKAMPALGRLVDIFIQLELFYY